MENITILGIVTLYNPDESMIMENIQSYKPYLDKLIIWDNSAENHKAWFHGDTNIIYHSTGKNVCIAPAINYASRYMKVHGYKMLLVMDQDSRWDNFSSFMNDAKTLFMKRTADVFTPYIRGCDNFKITSSVMNRRLFINSGTLLSSRAMSIIGEIDEQAFPLDALDHDMALTLLENGGRAVCLTGYTLTHSLGNLKRMGLLKILTHDYNAFRTYSMTRSHIICHRKHHKTMNGQERKYIYREILLQKTKRILLAENDKWERLLALLKGVRDGLRYRL